MAKLHIGLSGYDYRDWQGEGLFYAPSVKKANYLSAYAEQLNSLEANGTFQRIPGETTTSKWLSMTGPEFTISPKMVQNVTHFKRLNAEAIDIAKEFVQALRPIEEAGKLGPILLQLPPNLKRDDDRLAKFLGEFPGVRWAVEFRNSSWNCDDVESILKRFGVAWAAVETDDEEAQRRDSADYFFARMRRLTYTEQQLNGWAATIRQQLSAGKDCFVYCRHKDTVEPWKWAFRLRELVG